jgi:hypothetical protein
MFEVFGKGHFIRLLAPIDLNPESFRDASRVDSCYRPDGTAAIFLPTNMFS